MKDTLGQTAINFIENLVGMKARVGESFTSLDIANAAKTAGYYARNRMVADWLRSNAIRITHSVGALYNQTLIKVQSKADGATLAYLYHDMNTDPDSYLDRDQNPKSYVNPPVVTTIVSNPASYPGYGPVNTNGKHHSNFQRRDANGRFI